MTANVASGEGLCSIPKVLARNAQRFSSAPAYREKEFGIWQSWTWAETEAEIEALALGLLTLGLEPGTHVAIIGRNRPHFYWSMVAVQMVGAVPVPIYQDSVAEEIAYVLDHCGAQMAIVEDQEQVDKIIEIKDHPWFVACQFHPEFTSTPRDGHPLFSGFIEAALRVQTGKLPEGVAQL